MRLLRSNLNKPTSSPRVCGDERDGSYANRWEMEPLESYAPALANQERPTESMAM